MGSDSKSPLMNVLVVEDDPDMLSMLASYMRGRGHHVKTAPNVAQALKLLAKGTVDLVISDYEIGTATPQAIVEYLEKLNRQPSLIIFSGHEEDMIRSKISYAPGFTVIPKNNFSHLAEWLEGLAVSRQ